MQRSSRATVQSCMIGKLVWGATLTAIAGVAYIWLTATVPGGEERYQQYMRLAKERGGLSI